MKKPKIKPAELKKLLSDNDLEVYNICKICSVSMWTANKWMVDGIPEAYYKLIKLSLGGL